MNARAIILLCLAAATALGGGALAQTRRHPYEVPNLAPNYDPYEMKADKPWEPKKTDPYAIRQEPYPYSTPQSQARAAREVREYNARRALGYTPPPAPAAAQSPPRRGQSCNRLFYDC